MWVVSIDFTTLLQVLPGRTHPLMTMSGGGGYLLHSTYVYVAPPFQNDFTILTSHKIR